MSFDLSNARRWAVCLLATTMLATVTACGGGDEATARQAEAATTQAKAQAVIAPQADPVSVVAITKVSETRVSRTVYDYVFKVSFKNTGADAQAIRGTLTTVGAGTTVVDGTASLDSLASGASAFAQDTITLRHDRSLPFDQGALVWRVQSVLANPPLQAGIEVFAGLSGRSVVGQPYQGRIRLAANDTRDPVVALALENRTSGGSRPTISLNGDVNWQPSAADFSTTSLYLCVTQQSGANSCFDLPVWVTKFRQVAQIALAGAGSYSDPVGRYVVRVTNPVAPGDVTGSLTIEEQFDVGGYFTPRFTASTTSYGLEILRRPRPSALPPSMALNLSSTQAKTLSAKREATSTALTYRRSIRGSKVITSQDADVYTTREDSFNADGSLWVLPEDEVARVESSCDLAQGAGCRTSSRSPIILIHGFTPEIYALGGGTGTWGSLAARLQAEGHQVFELRWYTQMRFEEAAGLLVELARQVFEATGAKPFVIAHSFGGVVAHLAAGGEGVIWDKFTKRWVPQSMGNVVDRVFAGLITLDSPLSGINASSASGESDLPVGRYFDDFTIKHCRSVTCVQAGALDVDALSSFQRSVALILSPDGHLPAIGSATALAALSSGESIKRIRTRWMSGDMTWIQPSLHTVVGLRDLPMADWKPDLSEITAYRLGDGLISMMGQAVLPGDFTCSTSDTPPYIAPSNYKFLACLNSKLQGTYQNVDFLQSLERASNSSGNEVLVRLTTKGRNYYFVPRAAHTGTKVRDAWVPSFCFYSSSKNDVECGLRYPPLSLSFEVRHSIFKSFAIAQYSGSINISNGEIAHPLDYFILGILQDQPVLQATNVAATIKGRIRADNVSLSLPLRSYASARLLDATTGLEVGSRIELPIAPDGTFAFDAGRWIRGQLGSKVKLSNYLVKVQAGIGDLFLSAEKNSAPLSDAESTQDLGDFTFSALSQPQVGALSGSVVVQGTSTVIPGASVWIASGFGLTAVEVRDYSANSQRGRRVIAGMDGRFAASDLLAGWYTLVVSKDGYEAGSTYQVQLGTNPANLSLELKPLAPVVSAPPSTWPTSCNGKSTVLGGWTTFGTTAWDAQSNTYKVGDGIGHGDSADVDKDCNPFSNWNPGGPNGEDNDWLIYNQAALGDVDFVADACITWSPLSAHHIALFKADPLFTGLPRSGHSPIIGQGISFFVQWNRPGTLQYSASDAGGTVVGDVPGVPLSPNGFCAKYRLLRSGAQYSLYANDRPIFSKQLNLGALYPMVFVYDNVVSLKPTVTMGQATSFNVDAANEAGTSFVKSNAGAATCTFTATGVWGENSLVGSQISASGIGLRGAGTLLPTANEYALVVKYRNAWTLAGSSWTAPMAAGESVTFAMNDTPGAFFNNVGALTVNAACSP